MATVISEIRDDHELTTQYNIDIYDSYVDGGKIKKVLFSIWAFLIFYLTKRNYDIYHIHVASRGSTFRKGYYVRAAKKWGKRIILHIHGAQYMKFYNEISDKKKSKVISILKSADMVIALSKDWKDKFDHTFGLTNCVVLENGINMERLAPAVTSPEIYQNAFVTLGRLGKRKGTYDLVEAVEIALKTVPDIKVYLAGDGDVNQIRQLVQKKNLTENIKVVGWANYEKKIELLKHVSTVVLPSYNEGLPMSVLEGMACRKAIISTKVKEGNGILVEAGDVKKLAKALIICSSDTELLCKMANKNMEIIKEHYNMQVMHKRLANYYERSMQ